MQLSEKSKQRATYAQAVGWAGYHDATAERMQDICKGTAV